MSTTAVSTPPATTALAPASSNRAPSPIHIPPNLLGPSACDTAIHYAEIIGRVVGGGLLFIIGAVYYNSQETDHSFSYVCFVVGGFLWTLQLIDMTCGRGNTMAKLFEAASETYVAVLAHFRQQLDEYKPLLDKQGELAKKEESLNKKLADLAAHSNTDSAEMGNTVNQAKQVEEQLSKSTAEINGLVRTDSSNNHELTKQVETFTAEISKFHIDIQQASDAIPALKDIHFNFDRSVSSFSKTANQILTAFHTIIAQITSHAGVVATLKSEITDLQSKYGEIERTLENASKENQSLLKQIDEWRNTSENIATVKESLKILSEKLDQEHVDLTEQKRRFEQERKAWESSIKQMADHEIEMTQFIDQGKHSCEEQERLLQILIGEKKSE